MGNVDQLPVVREGTYLYAQSVPIQVRIVTSPETWGAGDYEDEDAIAENKSTPCFFVLYEMAGKPGEFCNVVPNIPTLEAAYEFCGEKFPNIQWQGDSRVSWFSKHNKVCVPHLHDEGKKGTDLFSCTTSRLRPSIMMAFRHLLLENTAPAALGEK